MALKTQPGQREARAEAPDQTDPPVGPQPAVEISEPEAPRGRAALAHWALAAVMCAGAIAVRLFLSRVWTSEVPFILFFPAVVITGLYAGLWPGVFVALVCGVVSWFYILLPHAHLAEVSEAPLFSVAGYVLVCLIMLAVTETTRRSASRARKSAVRLRIHQRRLEQEMAEREQAESIARERLEELETLLETIPTPVWISNDPDCRRIVGNGAADELLKVDRSANISKSNAGPASTRYTALRDGRELTAGELPMQQAVATGRQVTDCELTLALADGTIRRIMMNAAPLFSSDGKVRGAVGVAFDMTDQKSAEEAIARLASIVELSEDAIVATTLDGTVVSWNAGAERLYGYSQEEMIGASKDRLHPPELQHELYDNIRRIQSGERVEPYETVRLRKDGEKVQVSVAMSALHNGDGRLTGAATISRDITARKTAERELKRSQESLAHAQRIASLGSWDWLVETGEVFWSEEMYRIYGLRPEEAGLSWASALAYIHPEDEEETLRAINEAISEARPLKIEHRILRPGGEVRWLLLQARGVYSESGNLLRLTGTALDVTERRRTDEALRLSERRYRSLTLATSSVVWVTDAAGSMIERQRSWERYTGQTERQYHGFGWIQALHAEDRSRVETEWLNAIQSKSVFECEARMWHAATRSYRHCIARSVPVLRPDGVVQEWVGMMVDVHEQRLTEEAVQEGHRILHALLEYVPEGIAIAEAPGDRIRYMSSHALDMVGHSARELQDISLDEAAEILGARRADGTKADPHDLPLARAVEKGEIVEGEEWNIRRSDGELTPVLCNAAPLMDDQGRITGAVAVWRDIALLKRTEAILVNKLEQEHEVSQTLQRAILSQVPNQIEGVQLVPLYHPAHSENLVGGDFYNAFRPRPGKLALVIGDVAGKGLRAARRTAFAKYILQGYALEDPSPASVLTRANNALCRVTDSDSFVTLFYGLLDIDSRTLTFASAGHEPPLLIHKAAAEPDDLEAPGTPLGIVDGHQYSDRSVTLAPGDRLLLYTDGVTESRRGAEFLDLDGLKELIGELREVRIEKFLDTLMDRLHEFSGGDLRDDVAALLIALA